MNKFPMTVAGEAALQAELTQLKTEARPKVNSLMMFYFLYDSLGAIPQKKLTTRMESILQDIRRHL